MKTQPTQRPQRLTDRLPRRARGGRLLAFSLRALSWPLLLVMLAHGCNIPLAAAVSSEGRRASLPAPKPATPNTTTTRTAPPQAETITVFGPRRYTRATGSPNNVSASFTLPADALAPFNVTVQNGEADGSNRASSAVVKLNGTELFRPNDFNQNVATLTRDVKLNATNTVEVLLRSAVGSHITVTFTAKRTQSLPPALEVVEPARATQGQSLAVTLRGRNTHWAAGQTRLSLGGEISVGGAAPGEPGLVTVVEPGVALAEVVVSPTAALAPRAARVSVGTPETEVVTLVNALTIVPVTPPGAAATRVSTLAGTASSSGFADGPAAQSRFNGPTGVAVGSDDTVYVADAGNHRVRAVRPQTDQTGATAYTVTTLAGNGTAGLVDGPGAQAQFNRPLGVAVDAVGVVYVADTGNHSVRRVATDGTVTTIAGDGTQGFIDGPGAQSRFSSPHGLAVDNNGNVYVADTGNAAVRRIAPDGTVTTLAGDGTVGSADSPSARFDGVSGIASDGEHLFVYLADAGNHRIRRLDSSNTVITIAGAGRGFADGTAAEARFAEPSGVGLDGTGQLVVADAVNSLVRLVSPALAASGSSQTVTTLAGAGERGALDGQGDQARFATPRGIAVSPSSAVIVADTGNNTLRRVLLPPVVRALTPDRARAGEQISVIGERFDARAPGRNHVRFTRSAALGGGLTEAHILSATRTSLTVEVPADAGDGPVSVETEGGTAVSPSDFQLIPFAPPVITDFNPKRGPVGTTVTLVGTNFRAGGNDPVVSFAGPNSTRLNALVTSAVETQVRVLVPNGAVTGAIDLTNAGGRALTPSPFTVESDQDFRLVIAPSTATAVQGGSASYVVSLTSQQASFSQMAQLSVEGLPQGVATEFEPEQITSGARSTLSVALGSSGLAPGSYPFTVKAVTDADGRELVRTTAATLNVLAGGQTTLSGRVLSSDGEPIMGATASLDGRTATTDAAGSFILSGVTAGLNRPLMIDGRTASAPNRTYPLILEPANIVAGQANVNPFIYYLPPIDTQYEVEVIPGQTTVATNPRVPGLEMTIPADAVLRNRDNTPVARVSITPLAIDRTPAPLPDNIRTSLVYTSQPGGALTSVPIPVVYPNLAGADPGTRVELISFNHDFVRWDRYGFGRVSADGRTINPEIDPNTGRPYGLKDFSWHFPNAGPGGNPGGGGGCPESTGPNPVDYSTGIKLEEATDVSFSGARGGITLSRIYTSDLAQTCDLCPFGRGTTHNYAIRLNGNFQPGGAGRVIMPDEVTGRLFSYAGQNSAGEHVFRSTATVSQLGDEVRRLPGGALEYRLTSGETMRFDTAGRLTEMATPRGDRTTLSYTGNNLTRVTDPVGRFITLEYDGSNRITRVTDPLNRAWRYAYEGGAGVSSVTDPGGQVTRYTYAVGGRLTSVTDPRGNKLKELTYDNAGRVVEQKFADGGVERYAYTLSGATVTSTTVTDTLGRKVTKRFNAAGYVIGTTDALGQTSAIQRDLQTNTTSATTGPCGCSEGGQKYDARGNVTEIANRLGEVTKMEYEPVFNRLVKMTDHLGRSTRYAYDASGNITSITNAANESATYAYDANGLITSITDALGHSIRMEYDAEGNVSASIDQLGRRTTMEYDAVGRLVATTDPLGHRTSLVYDALDRVTELKDPTGAVTKMAYDANGNVTKVTNALNQSSTRTFDSRNRPVSVTDTAGRVAKVRYDTNGKPLVFTSPANHTVRYTYDARGQVTSVGNGAGSTVRYKYDARGNLVSLTDQRGNLSTFVYDELYRPVEMRDPLGRRSRVSYDAAGNVVEKIDRAGRHSTFEYDALNRLRRALYPDAAVAYTYDAGGRLSRVDDSQSGSVDWQFDAAGRMLSETTASGVVRYAYNEIGQVTSMTAGDRAPVTYGYDAAGRVKTITQRGGVFTYDYDAVSRVKELLRPNGVKTSYAFDQLGRVERMTHAGPLDQLIEDYRYAYGNNNEITSITALSSAPLLPSTKTAGAADAGNRVPSFGQATYTFDGDGKTVARTDAQGTTNYTWDGRGRLTQATLPDGRSVAYSYDALGRMARRTSGGDTTNYLYNGPHVALDRRSDGGTTEYLSGIGIDDTLRQTDAAGDFFFLRDHLGSTAALTDASGAVVERLSYEPFGDSAGSAFTRYGFTGRERDPLTGLVHMRARWYDAQQGRFMTEDPVGMRGGMNVYAYALNNPLSLIDPFGLSFSSFMRGFARGFVVGGITAFLITAAIAATGGVAGAIIAALALGYGVYHILAAIEELMNGDLCPDERDELIGELIGGALGAALGGGAGGRFGSGLRGGGPRGGGPRGGGPRGGGGGNGGGNGSGGGANNSGGGGGGPQSTPTDLNAFGNRNAPRPPRAGKDITPDAGGNVGPESPPLPNGASTFGDVNQAPLTGHHHTLPAGTPLPEGLGVVADGPTVVPGSPHPPTHHTIYPTVQMPFDTFVNLFNNLPWQYGGKK